MHPEPADSPMSTMRSGSPPNAATLARNHSIAARRSRSGRFVGTPVVASHPSAPRR